MIFQTENTLNLSGSIESKPTFSHESHGVSFYTFPLNVMRLSKAYDRITVLVREDQLLSISHNTGDFVKIKGELRSFNNKSGVGSRLLITAFVREIENIDFDYQNELTLRGVICKPPVYRKTPLGREICDLMLAINRKYGRADYLPCIAWGRNAYIASDYHVGDLVHVNGRIQSREYIKTFDDTSEVRTTYEVSISEINLCEDLF